MWAVEGRSWEETGKEMHAKKQIVLFWCFSLSLSLSLRPLHLGRLNSRAWNGFVRSLCQPEGPGRHGRVDPILLLAEGRGLSYLVSDASSSGEGNSGGMKVTAWHINDILRICDYLHRMWRGSGSCRTRRHRTQEEPGQLVPIPPAAPHGAGDEQVEAQLSHFQKTTEQNNKGLGDPQRSGHARADGGRSFATGFSWHHRNSNSLRQLSPLPRLRPRWEGRKRRQERK